jgi:hypothetical protein
MELLKFYWSAITLAFTQAPGIAQDILFGIFIVAGIVLYFLKRANVITVVTSWMNDVTGWQIAATVLGTIFAIRLLLAPYWLYREKAEAANSGTKHDDDGPPRSARQTKCARHRLRS